jgi:hypothetical protein
VTAPRWRDARIWRQGGPGRLWPGDPPENLSRAAAGRQLQRVRVRAPKRKQVFRPDGHDEHASTGAASPASGEQWGQRRFQTRALRSCCAGRSVRHGWRLRDERGRSVSLCR